MRFFSSAPFLGLLLLCACTTVKAPPKIDPPVAWAQRPDELGQLRVGKVVGVVRAEYDNTYRPAGVKIPMLLPIGGALVPLTATSTGRSSLLTVKQEYFRYTVRLKSVAAPEVWDDFVDYPIGSCIAFREQPPMIVPALPQECE